MSVHVLLSHALLSSVLEASNLLVVYCCADSIVALYCGGCTVNTGGNRRRKYYEQCEAGVAGSAESFELNVDLD